MKDFDWLGGEEVPDHWLLAKDISDGETDEELDQTLDIGFELLAIGLELFQLLFEFNSLLLLKIFESNCSEFCL